MSDPTTRQKALAAQVILPLAPLPTEPGPCPAWIESRSTRCKKPATDGYLCKRHHHVAERRLTASIEKRRAAETKAAARAAAREPRLRADLAATEEKITRLHARISAPESDDLAAYGGKVHPGIAARQDAAVLRDTAVGVEIGRLEAHARGLRRQLGVTA